MTIYRRWNILLVPFPFTDQETTKKRPALVISPDIYNQGPDVTIAFITSNLKKTDRPGDYLIKDWKKSGLPKPSMIRMKFATIHRSIIIKKIGRLFARDQKGFQSTFLDFFS